MIAPLVTVAIPTFNRSAALKAAIRSATSQTFRQIEIIVVDDCSSPPVSLHALGIADPRVSILRNPQNRGGGHSRNRAVEQARGKYVAFLDSDDTWLPTKLEAQLQLVACSGLEHADDWVIYNTVLKTDGATVSPVPPRAFDPESEHLTDFLIAKKHYMQTSGLMLPIRLMRRFPFDNDLRRHQDWSLLLDLHAAGVRFLFCDAPTVIWNCAHDRRRVSMGDDVAPTTQWLQDNRHRLSAAARAELMLAHVAARLARAWDPSALGFAVRAICINPRLLFRLLVAARKIRALL